MISVIIPCYNSEKYVDTAIKSVLSQTYSDYEIILVDNNSSDSTITILNKYALKYPGKIKVFHEVNKGAPAARNKGLKEAIGEWIQFLDSDDELISTKFEEQLQIASASNSDLIVGNCYMQKVVKKNIQNNIRYIETKNVWKGLLLSQLGITSANLWRKEALKAVNGWNETKSSSQEYDLIFRMLKNNENVGYSTQPLTIVHVRENSLHKSKDTDRTIEVLNNNIGLRIEIREYLRSNEKLTKELERIANEYIYAYLINATGITPVSKSKTPMASFIKKTFKQLNLNVSSSFIINFYFNFYKKKLINKLFR